MVALAIEMIHVIINENLIDADYVEEYTVGYEELKGRLTSIHWVGCRNYCSIP